MNSVGLNSLQLLPIKDKVFGQSPCQFLGRLLHISCVLSQAKKRWRILVRRVPRSYSMDFPDKVKELEAAIC